MPSASTFHRIAKAVFLVLMVGPASYYPMYRQLYRRPVAVVAPLVTYRPRFLYWHGQIGHQFWINGKSYDFDAIRKQWGVARLGTDGMYLADGTCWRLFHTLDRQEGKCLRGDARPKLEDPPKLEEPPLA